MKTYVYDLEVYSNFFLGVFVNMDDDKDIKVFRVYKYTNELASMLGLVSSGIYLFGYNNDNFDNLLISYIMSKITRFRNNREVTEGIKKTSDMLIESQDNFYNPDVQALRWMTKPYGSVDVMKVLALDKIKKSLKATAINVKFPKIQDLPFEPSYEVQDDDVDVIINYCINDVMATKAIIKHSQSEINLRFDITIRHGLNVLNSSRSKIGDQLITKLYSEKTGLHYNEFKDLRTLHNHIRLDSCILDKVHFETPELNGLLTKLKSKSITSTASELNEEIIYGGCKFTLATGGLHSNDIPKKYIKTDTYSIKDADVTSFYPYIILNERIKPRHLREEYFEIVKELLDFRVHAKEQLNSGTITDDNIKKSLKTTSEAYKIVLNSTLFGKLLFELSYMYDRRAGVMVTINGQLFLLMLIEKLTLAGIQVISANTDGVTCKVRKELEDVYAKVCKDWEAELGYQLEIEEYLVYARRDVNNYLAQLANGKIKRKGDLNKNRHSEELVKGFDMPIVAIAVENYLLFNTPVTNTIYKHRDIYDFCKSQKVGKKFKLEYHTIDESRLNIEVLQKTVRYYISNSGGALIKRDTLTDHSENMCVGQNTKIFNNYIEYDDFAKYDINYLYYIKEAMKIVNVIDYSIAKGMKDKKRKFHTGTMFDNL